MNLLNNAFFLTPELITILVIDLVIAVILLSAVRYLAGLWMGVNTKDELAHKDNYAFGISMAGSVAGVGIVLTGSITGEAANSYVTEAVGVLSYGVLGIILIKLGRIIHDKVALNEVNKKAEIKRENIAVAIVDAAATIATAIVIRAVLLWVEGLDGYTVIAVLSGFIVAQTLLVVVTRIRENMYAKANQGDSLQEALQGGQVALALRHSGHLISTALVVKAASYFLIYEPTAIVSNLIGWLVISLIMAVVMFVIGRIAKHILLLGINVAEEIDQQDNIGLAAIEMALMITIALMLGALMV
ncbi:hypothetical protein C2869_10280 [Saccharobesus litoralis]|uniref:ATP synthase F0 subunit A n=1 Tax=Saccharobesus litoralis TaxID=2172099 RepID=A0A2S0VRR6_9ALTE|nr:DUF350 domain-containing protein [Saccharobesus litoralis]AWB66790.1 hypothetical protein C2869_10280 [Saccharobesus litoralis]